MQVSFEPQSQEPRPFGQQKCAHLTFVWHRGRPEPQSENIEKDMRIVSNHVSSILACLTSHRFALTPYPIKSYLKHDWEYIKHKENCTLCGFVDTLFLRGHEEVPVHLRLPYISISYQQLQCRSQTTQLPQFAAQSRSPTSSLGTPSVTSLQTKLPAGSAGTEGCPLHKSCSHRDAGRSSSRPSAAKFDDKPVKQPRSIDSDISRCMQPCGLNLLPNGERRSRGDRQLWQLQWCIGVCISMSKFYEAPKRTCIQQAMRCLPVDTQQAIYRRDYTHSAVVNSIQNNFDLLCGKLHHEATLYMVYWADNQRQSTSTARLASTSGAVA